MEKYEYDVGRMGFTLEDGKKQWSNLKVHRCHCKNAEKRGDLRF